MFFENGEVSIKNNFFWKNFKESHSLLKNSLNVSGVEVKNSEVLGYPSIYAVPIFRNMKDTSKQSFSLYNINILNSIIPSWVVFKLWRKRTYFSTNQTPCISRTFTNWNVSWQNLCIFRCIIFPNYGAPVYNLCDYFLKDL